MWGLKPLSSVHVSVTSHSSLQLRRGSSGQRDGGHLGQTGAATGCKCVLLVPHVLWSLDVVGAPYRAALCQGSLGRPGHLEPPASVTTDCSDLHPGQCPADPGKLPCLECPGDNQDSESLRCFTVLSHPSDPGPCLGIRQRPPLCPTGPAHRQCSP